MKKFLPVILFSSLIFFNSYSPVIAKVKNNNISSTSVKIYGEKELSKGLHEAAKISIKDTPHVFIQNIAVYNEVGLVTLKSTDYSGKNRYYNITAKYENNKWTSISYFEANASIESIAVSMGSSDSAKDFFKSRKIDPDTAVDLEKLIQGQQSLSNILPEEGKSASEYLSEGDIFETKGDYSKAIISYKKAKFLDPAFYVYNALGRVYFKANQIDRAIIISHACLIKYPDDAMSNFLLAYSYTKKRGISYAELSEHYYKQACKLGINKACN